MEVGGEGESEIIHLSLHCHHQDDFCINLRPRAMRAILMSVS